MKNINTGVAKSSIKSVAKSASSLPDGKVSGMKSNNGIENAVSAIEGKERSEATIAGRDAYLSGRMHKKLYASASSPIDDQISR